MSKAHDSIAYEPFGERLELRDPVATPAPRGTTRFMGIAVFWTVAALLVAARIYVSDPAGGPVEAGAAIASAPQSVVIR